MRFDIVTLFPELIDSVANTGVLGRAIKKDLIQLTNWNPRDYAQDRHRTVDDKPYGGGPGMLMKVEPLRNAIQDARHAVDDKARVIYLSPQGKTLTQDAVKVLAQQPRLILLAGRYEGVDERIIERDVDEEWSMGDYVLSGGELPALVMIDAIARMIPGVLGDEDSAQQDSHMNGLLDCSHYTRPEQIDGQRVPEVLLGGDHKAIEQWRMQQALGSTWLKRPDLLDKLTLTNEQKQLLEDYQQKSNDN